MLPAIARQQEEAFKRCFQANQLTLKCRCMNFEKQDDRSIRHPASLFIHLFVCESSST